MGLWDKLEQARNYVRKRRGPDSYFQYKRKREDERKADERERDRAKGYAEQARGDTERGREYADRYTADRESDVAAERAERAEDARPDA
jgi:hypothetical protein